MGENLTPMQESFNKSINNINKGFSIFVIQSSRWDSFVKGSACPVNVLLRGPRCTCLCICTAIYVKAVREPLTFYQYQVTHKVNLRIKGHSLIKSALDRHKNASNQVPKRSEETDFVMPHLCEWRCLLSKLIRRKATITYKNKILSTPAGPNSGCSLKPLLLQHCLPSGNPILLSNTKQTRHTALLSATDSWETPSA